MLSSIVRQQLRCRHTGVIARSFVKLGEKVPVSYVKGTTMTFLRVEMTNTESVPSIHVTDAPDPVILKDEEYPDWVMRLHEPVRCSDMSCQPIALCSPARLICMHSFPPRDRC